MLKRAIALIILMGLSIASGFAQEAQTVEITESDINDTIDRFLEQSERNFDLDVKVSEGEIDIFLTTADTGFNFEEIVWTIVPTMQEGRVLWTLATWEATDTDGNLVSSDPRIQSLTPNIMSIWGRTLRNIVRDEVSETGLSISDIRVSSGVITVQIDHQLTSTSDSELPPNAIENADGSVSVNISEDMMNQSLEAVQNRYDAIDSLSVTITENTFNFAVGIERLCSDSPLNAQYSFSDGLGTINRNFEISDLNDDGTSELSIRANPSGDEQSFYTIELENLSCQGEPVSGQQSERVNSLLLPAVQRFLQLQTCDSRITNLEVLERSIVLIIPNYTECLTTHL